MDYYYGNRDDRGDFTKLIVYLNKKYKITPDNKWAAIVDFSAFDHPDIESIRAAVSGLTYLYIFISSDSIYDAYGLKYSSVPLKELTDMK
jgi:hypothetical protein